MGPIRGWWENKKRERRDRRAVEDWVDELVARERAERKRIRPRALKVGVIVTGLMMLAVGCQENVTAGYRTKTVEVTATFPPPDNSPKSVTVFRNHRITQDPITEVQKACAFFGGWLCPGVDRPKTRWWRDVFFKDFIGYRVWYDFLGQWHKEGGYWTNEVFGGYDNYLTCERLEEFETDQRCMDPALTGVRG